MYWQAILPARQRISRTQPRRTKWCIFARCALAKFSQAIKDKSQH